MHGGYLPSNLPKEELGLALGAVLDVMRGAKVFGKIRQAHAGFEEYLLHRNSNKRLLQEANILATLQVMEKIGTDVAGDVHGFTHPASGDIVESLGGHFAYLVRNPVARTISKIRLKYHQIHTAKAAYEKNRDIDELTKPIYQVLNSALFYVERAHNALNIDTYTGTNTVEKLQTLLNKNVEKREIRYLGGLVGNRGFYATVRIVARTDTEEDIKLSFEPNEMLLLAALTEINIGASADREFYRLDLSSMIVRFEDLTTDRNSLKALINALTGGRYMENQPNKDAFAKKMNTRDVAPTADQLTEEYPKIMQFVADASDLLAEHSGLKDFYGDLGYSRA